MTAKPCNSTHRPGRAGRAPGLMQRCRQLFRNLARAYVLRVECNRPGREWPAVSGVSGDEKRQQKQDREDWALDQLISLSRRMDYRVTPTQIMHAVIDAVADAAAIDDLDLSQVHSEADLKRRVMMNLMIRGDDQGDRPEPKAGGPATQWIASLPCVLNAGNVDGFLREVIAEARTQAMPRVAELGTSDTEAVTRMVCDTAADIVMRRIAPDIKSILSNQLMDAHLPGALEHAKRIKEGNEQ